MLQTALYLNKSAEQLLRKCKEKYNASVLCFNRFTIVTIHPSFTKRIFNALNTQTFYKKVTHFLEILISYNY